MSGKRRLRGEEWIGIFFLAAASLMLLLSVRLCFNNGIWYDELYTMGLTDRSFKELTALTARDVHPPFYYYYVKAVQELCLLAAPGANVIVISKICSVLPLWGLFAYGVTKVRKHFGWLCAGLFLFCVVAMPNLPQYTVEIRMYTLSVFLVTAAYLHGYEIILGEAETARVWKDWMLLVLYGILAAYTHYFACAAVAMIYLYLLFSLLFEISHMPGDESDISVKALGRGKMFRIRKNRSGILKWILCVMISAVSYIPWMSAVILQVSQVKESYWILPLTWRTLGSCVKFLMKPQFGSGIFQVAAAVVLFAVYAGLFIYMLWKMPKDKRERQSIFFAIAGTGVLAGVVLFGFAASFLIRPVFIVRYMVPAAGCFWLAFSVFVSRTVHKKQIWIPVVCLLLIIGIGDFRWFRNDETWRRVRMEEVEAALEQIEPEAAVVSIFNQVQGVAGYYLPNYIYLWNARPEELICDIVQDKYRTLYSAEEIKELLKADIPVWFIGNRQADVLTEWEEAGIYAEERQEVMLEVYWITFYRLSLQKQ